MIDEHLYDQQRNRFLRSAWTKGRVVIVTVAVSVVFVLQAIETVFAIRGRR